MKVSRDQVEANGRRILDAASRLFREKGIQGVTVADVMQAAGLTHGAFYGYFKSKDDLVAQTLTWVLAEQGAEIDLPRYARSYLSPAHCQDRAGGCVLAGLGAEVALASPEARATMTEGLRRQIDRMTRAMPGTRAAERRQAAIGSWSAMVGGLILARLSDDPGLSEDVLAQTRAWVAGACGLPEPAPGLPPTEAPASTWTGPGAPVRPPRH